MDQYTPIIRNNATSPNNLEQRFRALMLDENRAYHSDENNNSLTTNNYDNSDQILIENQTYTILYDSEEMSTQATPLQLQFPHEQFVILNSEDRSHCPVGMQMVCPV